MRVTHIVDVPADITDEKRVFTDMRVQYPALAGWWISFPQVTSNPEEDHE